MTKVNLETLAMFESDLRYLGKDDEIVGIKKTKGRYSFSCFFRGEFISPKIESQDRYQKLKQENYVSFFIPKNIYDKLTLENSFDSSNLPLTFDSCKYI